ncbi:hypothetical protein HN018_21510 [Lichenicola cladoniae]|uniref:Uncharacterized protein n=1 Tax=Lichenicola cladoniae TaxID=1484109 RepID=A0A6M8HVA7_9PROT|nr:hypothetical protein [Lichenicola cladoniae]NPD70332.1 hypothetical protein [Acetobacteraceae bacterium]QKE92268.1 hypothetical protein HN018_21510 [Lichenicola cladoniae]
MTEIAAPGLVEIFHQISDADREAEIVVLSAMRAHFLNLTGTMREAYDAMTAMTPIAPGVDLADVHEQAVSGWWVSPCNAPSDRAILFLSCCRFRGHRD